MDQPSRRQSSRSNPRSRSAAGSSSRSAVASTSRSAPRPSPRPAPRPTPRPRTPRQSVASTSKSADNLTTKSAPSGSTPIVIEEDEKDVKEEEHEVEVIFTGLPCTCRNCGITFGSYHDYYCHLVYSPLHAQTQAHPELDLELKLASSGQPDVDLELRLRPPTDD